MKTACKVSNNRTGRAAGMVSVLLLMFVLVIACEKEGNYPDYNPPADHTISQDGVMHKSGLQDPLTNCVGCHGADLQGGNVGVSCFECHGQKW
jgi:cytochrome c553